MGRASPATATRTARSRPESEGHEVKRRTKRLLAAVVAPLLFLGVVAAVNALLEWLGAVPYAGFFVMVGILAWVSRMAWNWPEDTQ